MKYVNPATVFAAFIAGTFLSAMSPAAESAVVYAADAAAGLNYRNAVAACDRMMGSAARRCMRDAEAARRAAEIKARAMPGRAKWLDQSFPHAVEGATGDTGRELRAPDRGTPTYWIAPDVKDVPDNLADNALR